MKPSAHVQVRYHWQEGSVPPPHFYQYTIEAGPGPAGRITFLPGYTYEEPPAWSVPFEPEEAAWQRLLTLFKTTGLLDDPPATPARPPVGSSIHTLVIDVLHQQVTLRSFGPPEGAVEQAIAAVRALVPREVWDDLKGRHERYQEEEG